MKQFLTKLMTLGLFLLSLGCFYVATTIIFSPYFINLALFIIAIFVLLQACGKMDKIHGFGPHHHENQNDNSDAENKNQNESTE